MNLLTFLILALYVLSVLWLLTAPIPEANSRPMYFAIFQLVVWLLISIFIELFGKDYGVL